jgi:hypothetical protein
MDQAALHGMPTKIRYLGLPLLTLNRVASALGTPAEDDGGVRGSASLRVDTAKHDKAAHRAQKEVFHDSHHDDRHRW